MEKNITNKQRRLLQSKVINYYCDFGRDFPWRDQYQEPYQILIAELLLKRTTAQAVSRIYGKILDQYPTIDVLLNAKKKHLKTLIEPLGLVNQRYSILKNAASYISDTGAIPDTLQGLLKIPGVGDYTARAILSFAYDKPYAIVDSNVIRIYDRIFFPFFKKGVFVDHQEIADYLLPLERHQQFNFGLLDLSAEYCRPVYLRCEECPLSVFCEYESIADKELYKIAEGLPKELYDSRVHKGLSQMRLAELSGVSKRTIINIEKGRSKASFNTLAKLSEALGENLSDR